MHRRVGLFVLLMGVTGCLSQYSVEERVFSLRPTAENSAIPVTVIDARPNWERRSVPNEAMKLYTVEYISPVIWVKLAEGINHSGQTLANPPERAKLHLTSFRVIVKDQWLLDRDELEYQRQKEENPYESDPEASFLGNLLGAMIHSMIHHDCPSYIVSPHDYGESVTCEMEGMVTFHWHNGSEASIPFQVVENSWDRLCHRYWGDDIHHAVKRALENFEDQIKLSPSNTDRQAGQEPE